MEFEDSVLICDEVDPILHKILIVNIMFEPSLSLNFPNAMPVLWTLPMLKKSGIIALCSPNSKFFNMRNFVNWSKKKSGIDSLYSKLMP